MGDRAHVQSPTWERWREISAVCLHPRNLRSSLAIAVCVGTVLFAINQLDVVLTGQAGPRVWVKGALTLVLPFLVSNCRNFSATRVSTD